MKRILLSLAVLMCSASAVSSEEAVPGTPLALVTREKVQKELKLSGDQVKAIEALAGDFKKGTVKPAEVRTRLEKVLKAEQLARLEQISYQVRGGEALLDSKVAAALGLTKKQQADIAEIKKDADKVLRMLLAVARFRNAEARAKFIRDHYKEAAGKMLGVLDDKQKKQFTMMQGKAFDATGLDKP
jgi:hypothetical protein